MYLYHRLPLRARPTFYHDLRAGIFMGVRFGVVQLAALVACKSLDAEDWELALVTGAPIAGLAFSVVWARIAAGHRKMPLVVAPQLASNLLLALIGFTTGSLAFVLLSCAATLVFSISMPASSTIYRLNYPPTHRATIVGFIRARMLIVTAAVSGVVGVLLRADPEAYRYIFPAGAAFGVLAVLRFGRIKVRGESHDAVRSEHADYRSMLRILRDDSNFRTFLASYFLGGFATIMCMPLLVMVVEDDLGMSYDRASWIIATIPGLMMALTSPLWGRLLDRVNPVVARGWINLVWVLDPVLVFVAAKTGSALPLYCAKFLYGMVIAGGSIIWALGVNYFARREDAPVYQGLHMTSTGIRGAIAPFAGIGLARLSLGMLGGEWGGPRFVFLVSAGLLFCSSMTMFYLGRRLREQGRLGDFASAEAAADGGGKRE